MNSGNATGTLVTFAGCTGSTNANTSWNSFSLTRSDANKILDRLKDGRITPAHLTNLALLTTGDLTIQQLEKEVLTHNK